MLSNSIKQVHNLVFAQIKLIGVIKKSNWTSPFVKTRIAYDSAYFKANKINCVEDNKKGMGLGTNGQDLNFLTEACNN